MTDDHVTLRLSRETVETILRCLWAISEYGDGAATRLAIEASDAMREALAEIGQSVTLRPTEPRRKKIFRR